MAENFAITIKNKRFSSIQEACRECGISDSTVQGRIQRGWSIEEAFLVPPGGSRPTIGNIKISARPVRVPLADEYGNIYPSKDAACREFNIPRSTFDGRIQRGWSVYDALHTPRGNERAPKLRFKEDVYRDRETADALYAERTGRSERKVRQVTEHTLKAKQTPKTTQAPATVTDELVSSVIAEAIKSGASLEEVASVLEIVFGIKDPSEVFFGMLRAA